MKKFYIKSFGCVQNTVDAELIEQIYLIKNYQKVDSFSKADVVIINSCVVRESAENRVYGLINEVEKYADKKKKKIEIVVTGCLIGWSDKNKAKKRSLADSFSRISFISLFKLTGSEGKLAIVDETGLMSISFGCNNYCSYCVVPFARGPEKSRQFNQVISEARQIRLKGVKQILLIGQNVNSYGADLVGNNKTFKLPNGKKVWPVVVKSMGKTRIPTLFPYLLEEVSRLGFKKVSFVSSNPWDFSDKLIEVIAKNKNIDRLIHLPIQSGSDEILAKMNRAYTVDDYCKLVDKIKKQIPRVKISTDIIIGFPGETEEVFDKSFELYKKIGFDVAYLNKYSPRSGTIASKIYKDDILQSVKKDRWNRLNKLINQKS